MRQFTRIILLFSVAFAEIQWFEGSFADAQKVATNEMIMIDFYTDWCVWCKRLDSDVFPKTEISKFAKENLISIKIDAEKGEGIALAKKYNASGFPTILFTDAGGNEIDRIVGYLPLEPFLEELNRIKNRIDTFDSLQNRAKSEPNNHKILEKLGQKNEDRGDLESAKNNWRRILRIEKTHNKARYKLAEYEARETKNPEVLQQFIAENPKNENLVLAYQWVLYLIKNTKNIEKEIAWYRQYAKFMETSGNEDADFLNGYAWRMAELETNLSDALMRANRAINLVNNPQRKAQILDTKAEILWKLGNPAEAIKTIDEAIQLQPKDDYLQGQKAKFSK